MGGSRATETPVPHQPPLPLRPRSCPSRCDRSLACRQPMGDAERRPILLLVNTAAGHKPGATRRDRPLSPAELLGGLTTWGLDVELRELGEGEDTAGLTRSAVEGGRDVGGAGGDGTVASAASALVGSEATL